MLHPLIIKNENFRLVIASWSSVHGNDRYKPTTESWSFIFLEVFKGQTKNVTLSNSCRWNSTWHFHAVWFWTLLAPIPLLYWPKATSGKKEFTSLYLHRWQPIKWRTPGQGLKAEACTRNRIGTLITSSLSDLMTSLGSASFLSQMTITCLRLIPLRVFWALLYQLVMKSIPTDRPNWLRQCFN